MSSKRKVKSPPLAPRADATPEWLLVMRTLTGTKETPGDADNPVIMSMADEIARTYPEMSAYCAQYTHDSIAWCGLAAAYCMTIAGIRPPFGKTDTDRWMWALAWADDENYTALTAPVPGCIVVMERSGGGHVTLYESTSGSNYVCRGGNQSDAVTSASYPISGVVALVWPKDVPLPPIPRRTLQHGDTGTDVAMLQQSLGLLGSNADGDFGGVTQTQVESFQRACGLAADGVVGDATWAEVDDLDARMAAGRDGLTAELQAAIIEMANASDLADFSWPDRGMPPPGYIAGMALAFALAATWLNQSDVQGHSAATVMAQKAGNPDKDALAYYKAEFAALGMDNSVAGVATLRHLFVMLIGLGMRESSGKYCEGRDMSASNTSADTCEAGLFQTSWNIRSASPEMQKLFDTYWEDPNGFLPTFAEGVNPTSSNLDVYGSGAGAAYQWLAKYSPAFAGMTTAVGMRVLRAHWGPIGRREVDIVDLADELLQQVQKLLEETPPAPEPEPEPEPEMATVNITTTGKVNVLVNGEPVWSGT